MANNGNRIRTEELRNCTSYSSRGGKGDCPWETKFKWLCLSQYIDVILWKWGSTCQPCASEFQGYRFKPPGFHFAFHCRPEISQWLTLVRCCMLSLAWLQFWDHTTWQVVNPSWDFFLPQPHLTTPAGPAWIPCIRRQHLWWTDLLHLPDTATPGNELLGVDIGRAGHRRRRQNREGADRWQLGGGDNQITIFVILVVSLKTWNEVKI